MTYGEWSGSPKSPPSVGSEQEPSGRCSGLWPELQFEVISRRAALAPRSKPVTVFLRLCPKRGDTAWDSSPSAAFGLAHELWEAREIKVTGSSPTLGVDVNLPSIPLRWQPSPCLVPS